MERGHYGSVAIWHPTVDQRLLEEALDCLGLLDSYLEFEEGEMDQIEAQEEDDDDVAIS